MTESPENRLDDPRRLDVLRTTGLLDTEAEEAFDRLTSLAARILESHCAFVSLLDDERQLVKSCAIRDTSVDSVQEGEGPLSHSFCKHAVASGDPLVIDDAARDPRVADNPGRDLYNIGAYLGVPLITSDGHALGALCATEPEPRDWSTEDLELLEDLAAWAVTEIELRADIHKRRQLEEKLRYRTTHDDLTDLANRTLFWDRLQHAVELADRSGALLAVLAADLDGFKAINDTYGHLVGDRLLEVVAERLVRTLRRADTVARFGGDEFVVLLEDVGGHEDVQTAVERLEASMAAPVEIDEHTLIPSMSIGSFVFRPAGAAEGYPGADDPETIVHRADDAMYEAKRSGEGHVTVRQLDSSTET